MGVLWAPEEKVVGFGARHDGVSVDGGEARGGDLPSLVLWRVFMVSHLPPWGSVDCAETLCESVGQMMIYSAQSHGAWL